MLCYIVQDYFHTAMEYIKLEKVAFGGSKGQVLTGMVMDIFSEFTELMNKFTNSTYDPLDDSSDVCGGGGGCGCGCVVVMVVVVAVFPTEKKSSRVADN